MWVAEIEAAGDLTHPVVHRSHRTFGRKLLGVLTVNCHVKWPKGKMATEDALVVLMWQENACPTRYFYEKQQKDKRGVEYKLTIPQRLHSAGFEPAHTNILRPERSSLDRSDKNAMP